MRKFRLFIVAAVLLTFAAIPASASQITFGYYAHVAYADGSINCGPPCCGALWFHHFYYALVGTRTTYCDGSESITGDITSCTNDVQILDTQPCGPQEPYSVEPGVERFERVGNRFSPESR